MRYKPSKIAKSIFEPIRLLVQCPVLWGSTHRSFLDEYEKEWGAAYHLKKLSINVELFSDIFTGRNKAIDFDL